MFQDFFLPRVQALVQLSSLNCVALPTLGALVQRVQKQLPVLDLLLLYFYFSKPILKVLPPTLLEGGEALLVMSIKGILK